MIRWIGDLLALASIGAVFNAVVRIVLTRASSRPLLPPAGYRIEKWLVVIPARDEGEFVTSTLQSIADARPPAGSRVLVLLDGVDVIAERIIREFGFDVMVKQPAGPTKSAALAWFIREGVSALRSPDALLLLDVGSRLSPDFFETFRWSGQADVVQCFLSGVGSGAGRAAAASENFAQRREDVGRERIGWNVQLRGTGCVFLPQVFAEVVPRLVTQVEDMEMTLLLSSDGRRLRMGSPAAFVSDVKPHLGGQATAQRARWMAGQIELLLKHGNTFARFMGRRPAEGVAMLSEIFARPLSLTVLLRLLAAAFMLISGEAVRTGLGIVIAASALSDILLMRTSAQFGWRESAALATAWIRALGGVPGAFLRWRRARKS